MAGFFQRLKERVFGEPAQAAPVQRRSSPTSKAVKAKQGSVPPSLSKRPIPSGREPYFIQIGFDLGTAFSKCICRDVFVDKAWVHVPPGNSGSETPFLIASAVSFDGQTLRHPSEANGAYEDRGLYHVKMALEKVGLKAWDDPVLTAYHDAAPGKSTEELAKFVETCAIFLVAGALGSVKRDIEVRFPGHVEGDFLAVNKAVPVADANHPGVNGLFEKVLRHAWVLADKLGGHPPTSYEAMGVLIDGSTAQIATKELKDACFIYPEVSANVQGFVRSRTSREGIYLFSDTGAGTVDQSVFLFARPNGQDHLTYLHASVLPLGSSHLERLAALAEGDISLGRLEDWRLKKERGENSGELRTARRNVASQLRNGTALTVSLAKQKLMRRQQINSLRVIFGGGGHCEDPYRRAVIKQFDGNLFRSDEIQKRRRAGESFDLGMPIPRDLDLDPNQRRWMDRLTVAYGLSFERGQLATFTLPKEVEIPSEEEIWRPIRRAVHAPSKDEV